MQWQDSDLFYCEIIGNCRIYILGKVPLKINMFRLNLVGISNLKNSSDIKILTSDIRWDLKVLQFYPEKHARNLKSIPNKNFGLCTSSTKNILLMVGDAKKWQRFENFYFFLKNRHKIVGTNYATHTRFHF